MRGAFRGRQRTYLARLLRGEIGDMNFVPRQKICEGEIWTEYHNTVIRYGRFVEHNGQWPILPERVFVRIAEWSSTNIGGERLAQAFCLGCEAG